MAIETGPTILFVVNDVDFFVSHRLNLAIAASSAGYRAVVACPPGPAVQVLRDHEIEHIETVPVRSRNGPLSQFCTLISYYRVLRAVRPRLVHLITAKPVIFGGAIARCMRVPVVAAISGLGYVFTAQGFKVRLMRMLVCAGYAFALNRRNGIVVYQNEIDRSIFAKLGVARRAEAVLIKGSGVDLSRIAVHAEPCGPLVVLLPARVLRDKGVGEFAQAARVVRGRHPQVVFRLQGKLDPQNPTGLTEMEIAGWIRNGWIEHVPHSNDPDSMFAAAHIVVLPSYREGLPKSLVDAAAAGRPVVTTDVPGCRDAIRPGRSGLLVPARDVEALVSAIFRLVEDPELRTTMGAEGRRLAEEEFDIRRITEQHLAVYEWAVQAGAKP